MKFMPLIQKLYRESRYTDVKTAHKESGCMTSREWMRQVIAGETEPSIEGGIKIAVALGASSDQIVQACREEGDNFWWRLIQPSEISADGLRLAEKFEHLDPTKKQLILNMLEQLGR